ncbi:MAG: hypothetical protein KF745_09050 [Phycisphaeraceae bacterium]|nr:hypothetical protein [Phycisphaeraceae bacterium]
MTPNAAIALERYRLRCILRLSALVLFMVFLVGASFPLIALTVSGRLLEQSWESFFGFNLARLILVFFASFLAGATVICVLERRIVMWLSRPRRDARNGGERSTRALD